MKEKEPVNESPDHPLIEELSLLEPPPVESASRAQAPLEASQLEAYRRGDLEQAEVEAVERRLAHDAESRTRLVELAGEKVPEPSPFLRARVLRAFGQEKAGQEKAEVPAPKRPRSRPWAPMLVAALVLLSVAGLLLRGGAGGPLPEQLAYQVSARGLAEVRSGDPAAAKQIEAYTIEAYPETPIELVVSPTGMADGKVDFAVYRLEGEDWLRVAAGERASIEGGTAVFTLPARELVGEEPGDHLLLIAVARPGRLPARLAPETVEEPGDDFRFYRQPMKLLP